jgi:hypothetical protein
VEGTVVAEDGKAIPGATVAILPDHEHRQRRDLYHFVRADQHGDYSVHGLAPGNYKVLAWDGDVDMDAIYDSDFIKPYLVMSKTQTVKVSPKSKYNIALSGISDATDLGAQ